MTEVIQTIDQCGYEFEKPMQSVKISVVNQIYYIVKQMREDALFLTMHSKDDEGRKENGIVEATLRSVMDVIKIKASEKPNK